MPDKLRLVRGVEPEFVPAPVGGLCPDPQVAARDGARPARLQRRRLRVFFLWLLEPDEAAAHLRRERKHWERVRAEYERIREEETPATNKQRAFRIVLEGGIAVARGRIEQAHRAERKLLRRPRAG